MLLEVIPPVATHTRFDYFDIVVLDWLILGLFRGRKSGMSRELVPLVQWIAIVITAGALYSPVSGVISQNTYLSPVWANVSAYLLIAGVIHLICLWIKRALSVKLEEWDLFGPKEYFLGMIAGTGRFACMLLFGLALMNSCFVPAAQPLAVAKPQKIKPGLHFPTYGELEQDVLSNSFSGTWVQSNLKPILIAEVKPPEPKLISEKRGKIVSKVLASESKAGAVTKNTP
ncbi:MAG TPA: CvpA family protein [Verrucomicrobiae bacterium]